MQSLQQSSSAAFSDRPPKHWCCVSNTFVSSDHLLLLYKDYTDLFLSNRIGVDTEKHIQQSLRLQSKYPKLKLGHIY